MPFVKGQSGNPDGRRKELAEGINDLRALARTHTAAALQTLVAGLNAKTERVRIAAAEALLNRGWGTPTVYVEGNLSAEIIQHVISGEPLSRDAWVAQYEAPALPDEMQH